MILSINYLNKMISISLFLKIKKEAKRKSKNIHSRYLSFLIILIFIVFLNLSNLEGMPLKEEKFFIAVFPFENLSGTFAPLKDFRALYIRKLKERRFQILSEDILERFMAKNRIRYTGGIDKETARALKNETNVEAVLITSLEHYNDTNPPKLALTSRLVSTGDNSEILWIDGFGLAGDDSPGILSLGLIEDPNELLSKAIESLTKSLENYFLKETGKEIIKGVSKKFQPKTYFRSNIFDSGNKYRVAVIPFFNRSERKNAGEIMVLQFIKNLKNAGKFDVIEPGIVRNKFLTLRIIMEEGISLSHADLLFTELDVDLILSGKVMDYQDYQGTYGKPKVDFSLQIIERRSRKVVWSSNSNNEGDEGVFLFDFGKINTAHKLASNMVKAVTNLIIK